MIREGVIYFTKRMAVCGELQLVVNEWKGGETRAMGHGGKETSIYTQLTLLLSK